MSTLSIVYAQYKYTKGVNVILIEKRKAEFIQGIFLNRIMYKGKGL